MTDEVQGDESGAGAATGMSGGFDIKGLLEGIDGSIDGWYSREGDKRQAIADDPCRFVIDAMIVEDQPGGLRYAMRQAELISLKIYEAGQLAIAQSLTRWGRGSNKYQGGMRFAEWLAESVLDVNAMVAGALFLPPPLGPMLVALASVNGLDNRLPTSSPPSSSTGGYQLAPGVFLYAGSGKTQAQHLNTGKLRGPEVRKGWNAWREYQRLEVSPKSFVTWRPRLASLVGSGWEPGEPAEPGTKVSALQLADDDFQVMLDLAEVECQTNRDLARDFAKSGHAAAIAAALDASRGDLIKSTTGPLLAVAAVVVAALYFKR